MATCTNAVGAIARISKRQTFTVIVCFITAWIFFLYCRGLGDIEFIDMSEHGSPSLDPHDIIGMDTAHLRAKRHRGCWVFVVNEFEQFLLVKRKNKAPICPATWAILGGHPLLGESYDSCAERAMRDEVGVLRYEYLMPLEREPVLMHLDYGIRVDKQWTKIYTAIVSKNTLRMSDIRDNSEFTWVNFTEADHWLHQCPGGQCRYCNPSKVWKMDSNHTFSYYYSLIEMTVEYFHDAIQHHQTKLSGTAIIGNLSVAPINPQDATAIVSADENPAGVVPVQPPLGSNFISLTKE